MTTYTYRSNTTAPGQTVDWSNPANWTGGSGAPNDPTGDVVVRAGNRDVITLSSDITIRSLALGADELTFNSLTLAVSGAFDISGSGELDLDGVSAPRHPTEVSA